MDRLISNEKKFRNTNANNSKAISIMSKYSNIDFDFNKKANKKQSSSNMFKQ